MWHTTHTALFVMEMAYVVTFSNERVLSCFVLLQAVCEESRLEKERSAVLSELTMVNTIDYRMECQVLSALHAENQLSR